MNRDEGNSTIFQTGLQEADGIQEFAFMDPVMNMLERANLMKRTEEVNKEETIALVKAAMGDRSIRNFAKDIGVNASSISRILNGTSTEIRSSLIAFIVGCADPKSGVTLDKLLTAQGFTIPEERRPVGKREKWESKRLICDELLIRGYSVQYVDEVPNWSLYETMPTYIIRTDAFDNESRKWYFYDKLSKNIKRVSIAMIQSWFDGIMASYYRGLVAKRVSVVVDSEDIFNGMQKMLGRYKIKDEISMILVSMEDGKVLDEYFIPMEDDMIPESVLTGSLKQEKFQ